MNNNKPILKEAIIKEVKEAFDSFTSAAQETQKPHKEKGKNRLMLNDVSDFLISNPSVGEFDNYIELPIQDVSIIELFKKLTSASNAISDYLVEENTYTKPELDISKQLISMRDTYVYYEESNTLGEFESNQLRFHLRPYYEEAIAHIKSTIGDDSFDKLSLNKSQKRTIQYADNILSTKEPLLRNSVETIQQALSSYEDAAKLEQNEQYHRPPLTPEIIPYVFTALSGEGEKEPKASHASIWNYANGAIKTLNKYLHASGIEDSITDADYSSNEQEIIERFNTRMNNLNRYIDVAGKAPRYYLAQAVSDSQEVIEIYKNKALEIAPQKNELPLPIKDLEMPAKLNRYRQLHALDGITDKPELSLSMRPKPTLTFSQEEIIDYISRAMEHVDSSATEQGIDITTPKTLEIKERYDNFIPSGARQLEHLFLKNSLAILRDYEDAMVKLDKSSKEYSEFVRGYEQLPLPANLKELQEKNQDKSPNKQITPSTNPVAYTKSFNDDLATKNAAITENISGTTGIVSIMEEPLSLHPEISDLLDIYYQKCQDTLTETVTSANIPALFTETEEYEGAHPRYTGNNPKGKDDAINVKFENIIERISNYEDAVLENAEDQGIALNYIRPSLPKELLSIAVPDNNNEPLSTLVEAQIVATNAQKANSKDR